jgi:hypothetical protein
LSLKHPTTAKAGFTKQLQVLNEKNLNVAEKEVQIDSMREHH